MSQTPRQDYILLTRNIINALQSHLYAYEGHEDVFSRGLLQDAYKAQAELVKQHFLYLSAMYDKEFPPIVIDNPVLMGTETVAENKPETSKIIMG